MQRVIIPVSLFMLVNFINYNPSPTMMSNPVQNNCVPVKGSRNHLCPDCKDSLDAAEFSQERNEQLSRNTMFVQEMVGE